MERERGKPRKSSGCTLIISYYNLCMCVTTSIWRISYTDDIVFLAVPNLKPVSEKTACDEGGGGTRGTWRTVVCPLRNHLGQS